MIFALCKNDHFRIIWETTAGSCSSIIIISSDNKSTLLSSRRCSPNCGRMRERTVYGFVIIPDVASSLATCPYVHVDVTYHLFSVFFLRDTHSTTSSVWKNTAKRRRRNIIIFFRAHRLSPAEFELSTPHKLRLKQLFLYITLFLL